MQLVIVSATVIAAGVLLAGHEGQSATETRPAFEVASIKRNRSSAGGFRYGEQPGGRWTMVNASVASLIRYAYPDLELSGTSGWVESDRYDVTAKAEGNPPPAQMALMLRTLLVDRFGFVAHEELQEREVFALVVAREDRRLEPNLVLSKVDCDAVAADRLAGRTPARPGNEAPACGWMSNGDALQVGGMPMSRIVKALGKPDGRVIIDKTGLTGHYEFTLRYSLEPNATDDRPSLFTALNEQLGLKLLPDRAPLRVLVVDQIARPSED